jgi:hypothetical protein
MKMKTCKKCGHTGPDGQDFYSSRNDCKECVKARARGHRIENIDAIREYDRNRPNAKMRSKKSVQKNREKYKSDPAFKARILKSQAKWLSANKQKRKAHIIVGNAIRSGVLVPLPCEACRTTEAVDAHHEDYRFPLDVRWLCKKHHMARHKEINEAMRAGINLRQKGFSLSEQVSS